MTVYPAQTYLNGVAGGTPLDAAHLNTSEQGIRGASMAAMQSLGTPGPKNFGYVGWSHDPAIPHPQVTPASGVLMLQRIPQWVDGQQVAGMSLALASTGTLTAGSNILGLWDVNGNLLAQTADLTASLTAVGEFGASLLTPAALDGTGACWAGLLLVGSAMPALVGSGPAIAGVGSGKLPAPAPYRQAVYGSGLTALPPVLTMTSLAASTACPWLALW